VKVFADKAKAHLNAGGLITVCRQGFPLHENESRPYLVTIGRADVIGYDPDNNFFGYSCTVPETNERIEGLAVKATPEYLRLEGAEPHE
jgi:hypothetical protein